MDYYTWLYKIKDIHIKFTPISLDKNNLFTIGGYCGLMQNKVKISKNWRPSKKGYILCMRNLKPFYLIK